MSDAAVFVRALFGSPGAPAANGQDLLAQAASTHEDLLNRAGTSGDPALDGPLAPLRAYLGGAPTSDRRRLLCHPLFVEGLHGLAPFCPELRRWHDSFTAPPASAAAPAAPPVPVALGCVALAARLRADRGWQGECDLCTDVLGRLEFPFSDWTVLLRTDRDDCLAGRAVRLALDSGQACWRLGGADGPPFLVTSRADCLRLIADNEDPCDRRRLEFPDPHVRPRLQCASHLGHSKIRYDPVAFLDFRAHAGLTGGLVGRLLTAIRINSPAVYRELCAFLHTVRGFEFPRSASGAVASFSDPTLPGVMGFAVAYTDRHEPCLDPFCFTWFGHEMGHTKDYLCETVLYGRGEGLVRNPADRTGPVPRYGRPLAVRTIIQVPYVHLYEWALLMDFCEAGFHGLPWRVPADVAAVGEDLAAEIEESFPLIAEWARLTPVGEAAVAYFRELYDRSLARWRALRTRGYHRCS